MSWRVHVRLGGVDRNQPFAEDCETLVVNLHGCALQCPRPLRSGTAVQLDVAGRLLTGRVTDSVSFGDDQNRWMLGIALDQAGNHWGIQYPPEDWEIPSPAAPSTATGSPASPTQVSPGPRVGVTTTTDVSANRSEPTAAPAPLRPQTLPPPIATQAPAGWQAQKPSPLPVPAAFPPPPAPAAPVTDAVLQEIRTQLLQLQQAQAKQQAMLLQEHNERLAARATAEEAIAGELERVRQAKEYVESLVCSFPSILEAQAQEQAQTILQRFQPQASHAELEKLVRDAQQAAEAALEQRAARLTDELRRQPEQMVQEQRQASDAACAAPTSHLQALEERVQAWLAQETEKFHQTVRDAFRDAGSEIRGRIAQAVEMASQTLEARSRDIQQQISALAQQHLQELQRQADLVCRRLQASSEQSQAELAAALQARLAEALVRFARDAQQLAQTKT